MWRVSRPPFLNPKGIAGCSTARKIVPHAGMVKSMLRLFDELVKSTRRGLEGLLQT